MLFFQVTPLLLFYLYSNMTKIDSDSYGSDVALPLDMYSTFGEKQCFIEASNDSIDAMVFNYKQVVSSACAVQMVPNLTETIFGLDKIGNYEFQWSALMGARFEKHLVVATFNNEPVHSIPIALTAVFNALIRTVDMNGPELLFVNRPLPFFNVQTNRILSTLETIGITVVLSLWIALFGYVYMIERVSGAVQMQFISGLHPVFYWVWSFLFDCVVMLSATLLMFLARYVVGSLLEIDNRLVVFTLYFAFASLPLMYLLSSIAKNTGTLLTYLLIVGAGGVVLSFVQQIMVIKGYWKPYMENYFMIVPHFNMHNGMTKLRMVGECCSAIISPELINQLHMVFFQSLREEYRGQVRSLDGNVAAFLVLGPLLFALIVLYDMQCLSRIFNYWGRKKTNPVELKGLDADVRAEMKKVDAMTSEAIGKMPLVAKHLTKRFGKNLAVKDCTFSLNK